MKTKGILIVSIMLTGMLLFAAQPVLGGCEVSVLDDLVALSSNAPGTKYEGPLTIYFQDRDVLDDDGNKIGETQDLYLFLRLRKGWMPYAFSSMLPDTTHTEFINDPLIVSSFFMDTVMPGLYPGLCPGEPEEDTCPNVVLKSYTLDVSQDDPPATSLMLFYVVDIVLAVQD